jgi:hypothetical protein
MWLRKYAQTADLYERETCNVSFCHFLIQSRSRPIVNTLYSFNLPLERPGAGTHPVYGSL